MHELGCLPLDGGNDFGMAVTGGHHGYARSEVKEGVTVGIFDQSAQAVPCNQRITPRVGWRDMPLIQFDHALGIGPGQRSDQARQFCMR